MYLDEEKLKHYSGLTERLRRGLEEYERKGVQYAAYMDKQRRIDPKRNR